MAENEGQARALLAVVLRAVTPADQAPSRERHRRRGLSLLEVLLALSILGVSFFAIGELMRIGARSAEAARDHTTAQLLAETVMAQVTAGLLPPEAITRAPVDDPRYQLEWTYAIEIEQVDQNGLIAVTVIVQQDEVQAARPVTYSVVRWMIDPTTIATATTAES